MVPNALPPLEQLDPAKAWQPWRPSDQDPWNLEWAGHLYRRAGFGASAAELRAAVANGYDATFQRLAQGAPDADDTYDYLHRTGAALARVGGTPFSLRGWWVYCMIHTPHPLREKMTLFWHNHFATSIAKVQRGVAMFEQNRLFRRHALGRFGPMLLDVSKDPAMLVWLDSNSNIAGRPNENYAREIMELFSLGVGNYTEKDIREAARAFTGWHTNGEQFEFVARFHDEGVKSTLGKTGNLDGGDVVTACLAQPACARFLVRKLYKAFVSESPEAPDSLLEPLAEQLRQSDYDLGALMRTMLRSRLFFSQHAYRHRVKSPVEFVVGAALAQGRDQAKPQELVVRMDQMGQQLFAPPNVKGWEGGATWLNTATVIARHNFAQTVATGPFAVDLVRSEKMTEADAIVSRLLDAFVQGDIGPAARKRLVAFVGEGKPQGKALEQRVRETIHTILTMPESQLA